MKQNFSECKKFIILIQIGFASYAIPIASQNVNKKNSQKAEFHQTYYVFQKLINEEAYLTIFQRQI
ncbi:conserved domain protein [Streptococcus constellatus subsp. pharyngis SK1060 = CCUG 46377]|uniref:Conserved domain protein n=1 Tax=Streptococcus constellatus subsp. pharyngis SK1060 = CCUG 46377 TaxID=1035184 RepID=F9P6J8_STRCV|nr:conserved domain protein [Streptococcus constellatus subsp. pharyngis SK1060 = CCUG 46377]